MIHPIILCGGTGTRIWPSSRETYPKQFAPILGEQSPFQNMLLRLAGDGFAAPVVTTVAPYRYLAAEQAREIGCTAASVLIEPEARDTAAAVLSAAMSLGDDPDALLLVMPVDLFSGDAIAFRQSLRAAAEGLEPGKCVIVDTEGDSDAVEEYPAMELARVAGGAVGHIALPSNRPKQPLTGTTPRCPRIALMRRADLLAAYDVHAPELVEPCRQALLAAVRDKETLLLDAATYSTVPKLSFEDVVIERAGALSRVAEGVPTSGLEDWDSVWETLERDENGVALSGGAIAINCENSLLRSEDPSMQVLGIGLKNVVAVAMRDAVLFADRDHLAEIPEAVGALATGGAPQARDYPRFHRPWGWYETLILGDRFQVKRIMVRPGGVLSLQSHVHRSEHWVVVAGSAEVTVGEKVTLVPENGSVYIPVGETHRMANPGKLPMYLIEVQTGPYLGEDDIVRYEDIYDRC